ncbi:MAG: hypothetical protein OHK0031_01040 [Anaerolineales bacterium]
MPFPDDTAFFLHPFPPAPGPLLKIFQNFPVAPGLYGELWDGVLQVCGNYAPELAELAAEQGSLLALDSGGLPLRAALALGQLRRADLLNALAALPSAEKPSRLLLPQSLASAWKIGDHLDEISVISRPDFAPLAAPLETLAAALRLFPGQALLFSLPLLIFGWQAWLMGMLALFFSALLLGILWRNWPLPPIALGLTLGFLLSLGLAALTWNSLPQTWPRLIGFALAPLWYSFLMMGSRR